MDTSTLILAVLVAVAVLGQLCLPLVGGWNRNRQARQAKRDIARLLETAADHQIQQKHHKAGTVVGHTKGVGHEN